MFVAAIVPIGAGIALLAALGLQYLGGFAPCQMCIWERYPYLIVLVVAPALWIAGYQRLGLLISALLLAGNALLSGYHWGVEQGMLALPTSCGAGGNPQTVEELRALLETQPPSCDQVSLSVLGLSLAGWNGVYAALLALTALYSAMRNQRRA